jgi:methyl-accepting chemotaxis protein
MGLRLKFNLILIAIFAAGFATVGITAHRYLQQQAIDDTKRAANLILDTMSIANVDARVATALGSRIVEMRIREFGLQEAQSGIEAEALRRLSEARDSQITQFFDTHTGYRKLIIMRKVRGVDGVDRVRAANIDHRQIVLTAQLALTTLLTGIGAVFFAVFFVLNLMLDRMIVRPVAEMAKQADAVSIGDFSIAEFTPTSNDEIGVLGIAFNRMRRSTEEAIKLLKG